MQTPKTTILCSCSCHALCIESDPDWGLDIAFWKSGHDYTYSWRQRLRHIWRVIRVGHPYADSITLDSPEKVQELIDALQEHIENVKPAA
jgi:hypothetical protein